MKRALLISGGSLDADFAKRFVQGQEFDMVIAVDSGLGKALELGIRVDAAVGDFDSADAASLETGHARKEIAWEIHRPEKDETDTELAVMKALEAGCTELVILGALGGRFDHALGNVHLLYYAARQGAEAYIVDPQNRIRVLLEGREFRRGEVWGKYISFLPLTMEVKGITLTGFRYPLTDRDIRIGPCLCLSNELAADTASVSFREGVLLCVESGDRETGLVKKH